MVKKTRVLDVMARYHVEIEKSDEVANFRTSRISVSAFGTKRTSRSYRTMSAFGGKADISQTAHLAGFWKAGNAPKPERRALRPPKGGKKVLKIRAWRIRKEP
jgi:hypothetical protein